MWIHLSQPICQYKEKMENKFKLLNDEYQDTALSFDASMFKVNKLLAEVKQAWRIQGLPALRNSLNGRGGISGTDDQWCALGVSCEILKPGDKSWRKGKIRVNISFEFCPDEPEVEEIIQSNDAEINQTSSPLDDIRQIMNKEN
jgi:KGK domain